MKEITVKTPWGDVRVTGERWGFTDPSQRLAVTGAGGEPVAEFAPQSWTAVYFEDAVPAGDPQ